MASAGCLAKSGTAPPPPHPELCPGHAPVTPWVVQICERISALTVPYNTRALGAKVSVFPRTDENPKQHVPLDEYVGNLKSMVRYLQSVGVPEHRIVLITPPPLCEAAWERECRAQGKRARGPASLRRPPPGRTQNQQRCLRAVGERGRGGPAWWR